MYIITTELSFSAAHYLKNYCGPCENLHGHNWLVRASAACSRLNEIGIGIDFRVFKDMLREVLDELDHKELNVVLAPYGLQPSSENLARYIYQKLKKRLRGTGAKMERVEVFETPGNSTTYFE